MDAMGHPSRDDLLVMAYVDGELADDQRAIFDQRLVNEPELVRQVAAYRKLEVLARHVAPPEPADHEWRRIREEPVRRAGVGLGWLLLAGGAFVVGLYVLVEVTRSDATPLQKFGVCAPVGGFLLLLLIRLRDRVRLYPYDPYTEVQR